MDMASAYQDIYLYSGWSCYRRYGLERLNSRARRLRTIHRTHPNRREASPIETRRNQVLNPHRRIPTQQCVHLGQTLIQRLYTIEQSDIALDCSTPAELYSNNVPYVVGQQSLCALRAFCVVTLKYVVSRVTIFLQHGHR